MIIIHTLASEQAGLGNYFRCYTLFRELKLRKLKVLLFVLFEDRDIEVISENGVIFFTDIKELYKRIKSFSAEIKVFIIDLPVVRTKDIEFYNNLSGQHLVTLNDAQVNELKPDIYINTDPVVNGKLKNSNVKCYIGEDFQIVREDLQDYRPNSFQELKKIQNILIMFGGSDPGNLTESFLGIVAYLPLDCQYKFVLGPGMDIRRKQSLMAKDYRNVYMLSDPDIPKTLSSADIVITMGGMTSYEAMYLGKPVLAIEWEYMGKYVEYLDSLKMLKSLGSIDRVNSKILTHELSSILQINEIGRTGFNKIDGQGQKRIADIIEQAMLE